MAIIFNTDAQESIFVSLYADSEEEMSNSIMQGCGIMPEASGVYMLDDYESSWWAEWFEKEERITRARSIADESTIDMDNRLIDHYGHDMELLQDKELELFGLR